MTTTTTNSGGGLVGQLKIDPVTGKAYTSAGKVSGTDINAVRGSAVASTSVTVDAAADTATATKTTTVVVQGTAGRGIVSAAVVDYHLIISFDDGTTLDAGYIRGPIGAASTVPGLSVSSASINGSGHLILTMTDATTVDAGLVKGMNGTNGTAGTNGTNGKTILSGTVDPTGTDGTNGDFFLNTTTMTFFGPKGTPLAGWNTGIVLATFTSQPGQTTLPADATDLASAITLANATKALLISLGIAKA